MKLIVNPHKIEILKEPVNEREIDITKCKFEFADEITSDYVKEAYFTFDGVSYKQIIVNNQCDIPNEVLVKKGQIEIGVVAYLVENEEEIKRYNPSPAYFNTWQGSLKDKYENTEPITPTDKEQIEQAIADLEVDKQDKLTAGDNITIEDNVISAVDTIYDDSEVRADIQNLQTNKADRTEIPDVSNFITRSVNDLVNYYLKSETYTKTEVNNLIGSIEQFHFEIVEQLPSTGSSNIIYLVPRSESEESNVYDEYIYTNNDWEKIGSTDIDLSDYVTTSDLNTALSAYTTTSDLNTLLSGKQNTIDSSHKLSSDLVDDTNNTNKFVTSAEKTTWNGKVSQEELNQSQAVQDTEISYLESITEQLPKVSANGTDISLNDTIEAKMSVGVKGNTEQDGTPTPSSPVNIKVATGNNEVKVQNKNLLNENDVINGFINISNGTINTSESWVSDWNLTDYIPINNTQITLSYIVGSATLQAKVGYYDKDKNYISGVENSYSTGNTFTLPNNTKYIRFNYRNNQGATNIQLELGSSASSYVQHQEQTYPLNLGNITLCGLGDYRDYIYKNDNKWYIEKNINKVTYTGATGEGWFKYSTNTFSTSRLSTIRKSYCNYYTFKEEKTTATSLLDGEYCYASSSNNYNILIKNTNYDDASAFKTWLSTHNTIVYYVLDTPTTTEITDTTLIAQLNAIEEAISYANQTNLSSTYESGNAPIYFSAKAISKNEVKVNDVQVNGTSVTSNGIANIPMGTTQSLGVVKAKSDAGTTINQSGELIINPASDQQIKEGTGNRRPITPDKENASVFYGLAKASGDTTQASSTNPVGTYTDTAKQKIREMLGAETNEWEKLVDKTLQADSTTALAYTDYAYEGKFKKIMIQIRGTVDTNNANISFYRSTNSSAYQVFGNVARNSDTLYEFIMEGSPYLQSTAIRDSSVELKVYNVASNTWTMLYQGRAPMATKMDEVTDLKITSNGNFLTGTRVVVWGLR